MPTSACRYGSSWRCGFSSCACVGEREQRRRRLHEPRRQRQLGAQPVDFAEVVLERQRRLRADRVARACRRSTNGLPSRSPPIHEPVRRNGGSRVAVEAEVARETRAPGRRTAAGSGRGTCSGSTRARCRSRPSPAASRAAASPSATARAPAGRARRRTRPSRPASARCGRARRAGARSRARRRGCSCAALRSDARSAPGDTSASSNQRAERRAVDAGSGEALERLRDAAALRRRARQRVRAAAAILVHVLGDVGEMREIAERAHDVAARRRSAAD